MNIKIIGKNLEITDAIRDYISKKLERLEKYGGKNVDVNVNCSVEKEDQIVEMQINFDGNFIKIEEKNEDLYASVDLAIDKVERQMRKEKEKREDKGKDFREKFIDIFRKTPESEEKGEITKTKCYSLKPMSIEDAKMELEENGDMFIVFVNSSSNEVSVMYQRGDGTFGMVVPE